MDLAIFSVLQRAKEDLSFSLTLLSLNLLSILFPNPLFILSLSPSLSHHFPHSVLHPASGVASGAADSGGGG